MVTSSRSDSDKVSNLSDPWCAYADAPQNVTVQFSELIYLTQIQAVSTDGIHFSLYTDSNGRVYNNINKANVSLLQVLVLLKCSCTGV